MKNEMKHQKLFIKKSTKPYFIPPNSTYNQQNYNYPQTFNKLNQLYKNKNTL